LLASNDITLDAGTNRQTETNTYKSKGASIGATFTGGAVTGVDASFAKENSDGTTETVTHTGTTVIAGDTLTMQSGKDTNMIGSQVSGNTVKADIGGNLHIESLQDTETYRGHESSMGASVSYTPSKTVVAKQGKDTKVYKTPNSASKAASWSKGKTTSDYASVTKQAGIYAGDGGYQIKVQDNTHLKGAVIASTADARKNRLDTGSLTMDNIDNKASYHSSSIGGSVSTFSTHKHNTVETLPSLGIPVKGNGKSTTYSAISQGIITVAGKQTEAQINHDTTHALNKLEHIFNEKDVKERQQLTGLVAKEGFTLIGDLAISKQKELVIKSIKAHKAGNTDQEQQYIAEAKKWQDGGEYKILLHGVVGAVLSKMSGNGVTTGIVGAGLNETLQKEMGKIKDPGMHKLASALVGKIATQSGSGAAIAMDGTTYNWLTHSDQMNLLRNYEWFVENQKIVGLDQAKKDFIEKAAYYLALDDYEGENAESYGTTNMISKEFYDSVNEHDAQAFDYKLGIQFHELFNNLMAGYYTEEGEREELSTLRDNYLEEFRSKNRVINDTGIITLYASPYPSVIPKTGEDIITEGQVQQYLWGDDGIAHGVIGNDGNTYALAQPLNRGDYEYEHNGYVATPRSDNHWYIHIDGEGDYQVQDIKDVGDYYADLGYKVVLGQDGLSHYAISPDGVPYYTTYPLTDISDSVRGAQWDVKTYNSVGQLSGEGTLTGIHWEHLSNNYTRSLDGARIEISGGFGVNNGNIGLNGQASFDAADLNYAMGSNSFGGNAGIKFSDIQGEAYVGIGDKSGISAKYSMYLVAAHGNLHTQIGNFKIIGKGEIGLGESWGIKAYKEKNELTAGAYLNGGGIVSGGAEITVKNNDENNNDDNHVKK
jgi:hypothetical protein